MNITFNEDDFTLTRFFDDSMSAYEAQIEQPIQYLLDKASIEDTMFTAAMNARPLSYNVIKYFDNPGFAIFEIVIQSFANMYTIAVTIILAICLFKWCTNREEFDRHFQEHDSYDEYRKASFHNDNLKPCRRGDSLPPPPITSAK